MDEGKAAFYAAIIGFAAAIIGAAVGGWASWRAARHSADAAVRAAIEQVTGQAASEHAHWVRQERLRTYMAVFRQHGQVYIAGIELLRNLREDGHPAEPARRLEQECRSLGLACADIYLLGPAEVRNKAADLAQVVVDVIDVIDEHGFATPSPSGCDGPRGADPLEDTMRALQSVSASGKSLKKACSKVLLEWQYQRDAV